MNVARPGDLSHPLNYVIVAGEVTSDPRDGRSPTGDPVASFRVEFPVVSPDRPWRLWLWAGIGVEVPRSLVQAGHVSGLCGGAHVLVAGQVSERWVIEGGRSGRRGFIVASLVRPEADLERVDELFVPGWCE